MKLLNISMSMVINDKWESFFKNLYSETNKASGLDKIKNEFIKAVPRSMYVIILNVEKRSCP